VTLPLLVSTFVIATCGLVYELIAGTLASYLLGDSVTQFSTIIGAYLFAMGIGAYLSRHIHRGLLTIFVQVEILIGLVGGSMAAILFVAFEHIESFRILLYFLIGLVGVLVGLEIPILMQLLKKQLGFKDLVSKVFTFDYIGALAASVIFPLVLVPQLGLIRSSFLFGIFNVLVAIWAIVLFGRESFAIRLQRGLATVALIYLTFGFVYAEDIMHFAESHSFQDRVVMAKSSPYQRIVITQSRDHRDTRLFLNNNLQFSTRDEYRYHEALVHVGLAGVKEPKHILVLGGGDGMAVREILKYPSVVDVTLVDLDRSITDLFRGQPDLSELNEHSLQSPKVKVINADAYVWLREHPQVFDFVVVDFPDPSNFSLGKLFSDSFYRVLYTHVAEGGAAVVQSTSPFVARKSYWCVSDTLEAVGFKTAAYHTLVPSFGDWGFVLASRQKFAQAKTYPAGLKYLNPEIAREMFVFPKDIERVPVGVNRLNNQLLVRTFEEEWSAYLR
jgi:spermidine synthase